jgi:hypothetical protein
MAPIMKGTWMNGLLFVVLSSVCSAWTKGMSPEPKSL